MGSKRRNNDVRVWWFGKRPNKTNGVVRMVINTNIAAVQQLKLLRESSHRLSASIVRMSSGSRLASPQDDIGGLSQTINLDSQVTRINANLQSMLQGNRRLSWISGRGVKRARYDKIIGI